MASFLDKTPLSGFFYDPSEDNARALEALRYGRGVYSDLQVPQYENVSFTEPERARDITYGDIETQLAGPSAYEDISLDPELRKAQLSQLNVLEQMRDRGGFTAADEANLARAINEAAMAEKSQRDAIMQKAQMRGMGDSRAALLEQMLGAQSGANRLSRESLDIAGIGQERALKAGMGAAELAGGMESADFNRQAAKAQSIDAINKFNAQTANAGSMFNAEQAMRAQAINQKAMQDYYNLVSDMRMKGEMANKLQIPAAQYEAYLSRAKGLAGNSEAESQYYQNAAQVGAQQQGNLWGSATQIGASLLGNKGLAGLFGSKGAAPTTTAGAGAAGSSVTPVISNSGARYGGAAAAGGGAGMGVAGPIGIAAWGLKDMKTPFG